jgi:hypothetical protein
MIIGLQKSPRKNKRFRAILDDNTFIDFGLLNGQTYIDHKNKLKRTNYIKRHLANKKENYLIKNLIPSPALFSLAILWGKFTDIKKNIKNLNLLFKTI